MRNIRLFGLVIIFSCILSLNASAHVLLIYPEGGETFQVGQAVTIQWQVDIPHGPADWDLYFSHDGGSTWQSIATNLPQSQLNFNWTVPNMVTNSGRVKVVQDNINFMNYADSSGNFTINTSTGIKNRTGYAEDFVLYTAYPNPFNPSTTIQYEVSKTSKVSLIVYNISGEKIRTLIDGIDSPGLRSVVWNGTNDNGESVSSGIYLFRLQSENRVQTKKMILLQ